jgi:hypothetical protein
MTDPKVIKFAVCEAYAPAIANGEMDGLSESELFWLAKFMERETADLAPGSYHWCVEFEDDSPFGMCELSGMRGTLCNAVLVYDAAAQPATDNRSKTDAA